MTLVILWLLYCPSSFHEIHSFGVTLQNRIRDMLSRKHHYVRPDIVSVLRDMKVQTQLEPLCHRSLKLDQTKDQQQLAIFLLSSARICVKCLLVNICTFVCVSIYYSPTWLQTLQVMHGCTGPSVHKRSLECAILGKTIVIQLLLMLRLYSTAVCLLCYRKFKCSYMQRS